MLFQQSLLDGSEKVPVESSVNQQDEDLGDSVPVLVDTNKAATDQHMKPLDFGSLEERRLQFTGRRNRVCGYPYAKDGDVDEGNDECGAPFELKDC